MRRHHGWRATVVVVVVVVVGAATLMACGGAGPSSDGDQEEAGPDAAEAPEPTAATTADGEEAADGAVDAVEDLAPPTCEAVPGGASEVDISADWDVGDTVELELTTSQDEDGATGPSMTTPVVISVKEEAHNGYVLRWDQDIAPLGAGALDALEALDPPAEVLAVVEELDELAHLQILYGTDQYGAFLGIRNQEEVLAGIDAYFNQLEELGRFAENPELDEMLEAIDVVAKSPELRAIMSAKLAEDIAAYHGIYGAILAPGEPLRLATALPNPLGGRAFPARQALVLEDLADGDGCVTADLTIRPRPGPARRIIAQLVAEIAPDGAFSPEELEAEFEDFEISTAAHFTWDPATTWMVGVDATREATVGPRTRTDHQTFVARST